MFEYEVFKSCGNITIREHLETIIKWSLIKAGSSES